MKTALNQLCVEKEGERERKGEKKKKKGSEGVRLENKKDTGDEAEGGEVCEGCCCAEECV